MKKASLTLAICTAALALGTTASARPKTASASKPVAKKVVKKKVIKKKKTANQRLYAQSVSASKLWLTFSKSLARVSGTITVDEAVLPYITGQCKDIVVKAFGGTSFGDEIASMRATGDIYSGTCNYTMFVSPQSEMRVLSFYEGGRSPHHPGDYLEVNGVGPHTFAASAGGVYKRDFVLTYDFIK